jgi:hypothetical protein
MNREEGRQGYIEYPCILKGFFLTEGQARIKTGKGVIEYRVSGRKILHR